MNTDEPSAAEPQLLWSARTCPRFRQATCRRRMREGVQLSRAAARGPALATSRQSGKAVTSHRTPNLCRLCAKFHHCGTDSKPDLDKPENSKLLLKDETH